MTDAPTEPLLELEGISKSFGSFLAVRGVSLRLHRGEVVGIVGENGAGKSTLMKILGGVIAPGAGRFLVDGEARDRLTVPEAIRLGIALVHQELNLFENLSVAANILIGREPLRGGPLRLVDTGALEARAAPILRRLGADFSASAPVASLSLAQRQIVEIAKALSLEARILILDEPTSSLTTSETARLIEIVAQLRAAGVAVVLISHRLAEVEQAADRVVVLRDGRLVAELAGSDIRADIMVRHMIGRDLKTLYLPPRAAPGRDILTLRGVRTVFRPDRSIDLSVRAGEIVGLAGLIGSGRTELALTLFGLSPLLGGEIAIGGQPARITSAKAAIGQGIALVPEDRKRSGLILDFPIRDNITLPDLAAHARRGLIDRRRENSTADTMRQRLDIRTTGVAAPAGALSGGNQQKVVLARWLALRPRVLILDEPTRGVDVGAKTEIYRILRALADDGVAILMISSDMEEVIGVSDRVAVMHEGRIAGELGRDALTEEAILSLAVGR